MIKFPKYDQIFSRQQGFLQMIRLISKTNTILNIWKGINIDPFRCYRLCSCRKDQPVSTVRQQLVQK